MGSTRPSASRPWRRSLLALASAAVLLAGQEGPPLTVIDAESGLPVAQAQVWFLDHATWQREGMGRYYLQADIDPWLEQLGTSLTTGADGKTILPRVGPATITARAGNRWGIVDLGDGWGPAKLELRADRSLVLRAVDQTGKPVPNVIVSVRVSGSAVEAYDYELWSGTTQGERGEVLVPHIAWIVDHWHYGDRPTDKRRRHRVYACPGIPLSAKQEIDLEKHSLPAEPVTFTIPPLTSAHLEFALSEGRRLRERVTVRFSHLLAGPRPSESIISWSGEPIDLLAEAGMNLSLSASIDQRASDRFGGLWWQNASGNLPAAGEMTTIRFQFASAAQKFRAHVVQQNGDALARKRIGLSLNWRDDWSRTVGVDAYPVSDDAGAIEFTAPLPAFAWDGKPHAFTLLCFEVSTGATLATPPITVTATTDEIDLGEICVP